MKISIDNLKHQQEAVKSTLDLLKGQPKLKD